jgi:aspartyl-tRNA synthetase
MHHPFTSPKPEDTALLDPPDTIGEVRANACHMVINGVEVGEPIRIPRPRGAGPHTPRRLVSPTKKPRHSSASVDAFEYGAPPHRRHCSARTASVALRRRR